MKDNKATQIETLKVTHNNPYVITGRQEPLKHIPIHYESQNGYISDWFVKSNDKVETDQPLFEYYNPSIEQQINKKQKNLIHLQQINKISSPIIGSEIVRLQNQITQLQSQLRIQVFSPTAGIVYINPHWTNQTKVPVLQIYHPTTVIKVEVSEAIVHSLQLNSKVSLLDDQQQSYSGEVKYISKYPTNFDTSTEPSKYLVHISSTTPQFYGKHFKIKIPNQLIKIPKSSIYKGQFVYVQRNNKFIKRVIKLQNTGNKKDVLVLEGLNQGDIIAKNANTILSKN
ncbi:MAG TPA: efflux RND transporter periplasmic adaptor subunit [Staphylococcus sp.]|nr:efflux RND transporter periplasmic adaptor subunit [Staphylococcus sp.]